MYELTLPYPPSINHYYRHVENRTLISRQGRRYREGVMGIIAEFGMPQLSCRLRVEIDAYPPDNRERDADNIQKALLDALQHGGAYIKDSQIKDLTTRMLDPVRLGCVIVRLQCI